MTINALTWQEQFKNARLDEIDYVKRWQHDGEIATDVLEALEELEDAYDTFAGAIESVEDAIKECED